MTSLFMIPSFFHTFSTDPQLTTHSLLALVVCFLCSCSLVRDEIPYYTQVKHVPDMHIILIYHMDQVIAIIVNLIGQMKLIYSLWNVTQLKLLS